MKRLLIPTALMAVLAVPATAVAAPPSKADRSEGKRECAQLLKASGTRANFAQVVKLERKTAVRTAFKNCVKERSQEARSERVEARSAAVEHCRGLYPRGTAQKNTATPRNQFGQCVADQRRRNNAEADREQREETLKPAKACRAEEKADKTKFAATYGSKSKAFGTCVSQKSEAQETQTQQA